ncbi:MAG TPA: type II toxin-antitoxin system VapB family antitoxin [Nocardioidaceae bacterium]|nr:type II toxin-antitoxin system VapB family antitoxin [Nocardioidaceae bacterium]
MALSIKSEEADRLARELAKETGESLTEAIVVALRERLERAHAERGLRMSDRMRRLQDDVARLPVLDPRAPDAILDYDDDGLPA